MRVFLAKLTLLAFLPALFASSDADFSTEIRNKMLVAAIEIAELNHALNTDSSCQPWRWVYQTQQHWHAVVYLLIEICRRPWSATIERAWVALQSPWLLPARASSYRNPTVWVPLKTLMARARSHREEDLARLRGDFHAALQLDMADREQIPALASSTTFPTHYNDESFRRRWWQLIDPTGTAVTATPSTSSSRAGASRERTQTDTTRSSFGADSNQRSALESTSSSSFAAPVTVQYDDVVVPGAAMTAIRPETLDTFLGTETEMEFLDAMDDVDFLNFDWNAWFESANTM